MQPQKFLNCKSNPENKKREMEVTYYLISDFTKK